MKTLNPSYSLADTAHRVHELIADHDPRFVAVVVRPSGPLYGLASTSWGALCNAVGDTEASTLLANAASDAATYAWDENFQRDVYRMTRADNGDVLAILVRA